MLTKKTILTILNGHDKNNCDGESIIFNEDSVIKKLWDFYDNTLSLYASDAPLCYSAFCELERILHSPFALSEKNVACLVYQSLQEEMELSRVEYESYLTFQQLWNKLKFRENKEFLYYVSPSWIYEIGRRYEEGIGLTANAVKARKYFDEAFTQHNLQIIEDQAARGVTQYEFILGDLYYWGRGGKEKDLILAEKFYRNAAEKCQRDAQYRLGVMYELRNSEDGLKEAFQFYQLAAEAGLDKAEHRLIIAHEKEEIMMPIEWYNKREKKLESTFKKDHSRTPRAKSIQRRASKFGLSKNNSSASSSQKSLLHDSNSQSTSQPVLQPTLPQSIAVTQSLKMSSSDALAHSNKANIFNTNSVSPNFKPFLTRRNIEATLWRYDKAKTVKEIFIQPFFVQKLRAFLKVELANNDLNFPLTYSQFQALQDLLITASPKTTEIAAYIEFEKLKQRMDYAFENYLHHLPFDILVERAKLNCSPQCAYEIGRRYERGMNIAYNQQKANEWYAKAFTNDGMALIEAKAKEEDSHSLFILGRMYDLGSNGKEKDAVLAKQYYTKASDKGHKDAQRNLGLIAYTARQYAQAVQWYTKAALQGDGDAEYDLGAMAENGHGCKKDEKEAFYYYMSAAQKGLSYAKYRLGWFYENAMGGLAKDMSKAVEYYKSSAIQGDKYAQFQLANLYQEGEKIPKNYYEAARLYDLAARQDHSEAQYQLAYLFEQGLGIVKDKQSALYWYQEAAKQNPKKAATALLRVKALIEKDQVNACLSFMSLNGLKNKKPMTAECQYEIGRRYERGMKVPVDSVEANRWYALALTPTGLARIAEQASQGDVHAEFVWGRIHHIGQGKKVKNIAIARQYYEKAGTKGHSVALFNLGYLEFELKNYEEALKWFLLAEKEGYQPLSGIGYYLGDMYYRAKGVIRDDKKAFNYYQYVTKEKLSATYSLVYGDLAYMYENGQGTAVSFPLAIQWYQKGSEFDNTFSCYRLGKMYEEGKGTPKNEQLALQYYEKAAAKNHAEAVKALAALRGSFQYRTSTQNLPFIPFEDLMSLPDSEKTPQVCFEVAYRYNSGYRIPDINEDESQKWEARVFKQLAIFRDIKHTADQGDAYAQVMLGFYYIRLDTRNLNEAVKWFRKAATQNNSRGQCELADKLEIMAWESVKHLEGVNNEQVGQTSRAALINEAKPFYLLAAQQGNSRSQIMMSCIAELENKYADANCWLDKAIKQTQQEKSLVLYARSKYAKARLYQCGHPGVEQNLEVALSLFKEVVALNVTDFSAQAKGECANIEYELQREAEKKAQEEARRAARQAAELKRQERLTQAQKAMEKIQEEWEKYKREQGRLEEAQKEYERASHSARMFSAHSRNMYDVNSAAAASMRLTSAKNSFETRKSGLTFFSNELREKQEQFNQQYSDICQPISLPLLQLDSSYYWN